jgi:hypothetical protein
MPSTAWPPDRPMRRLPRVGRIVLNERGGEPDDGPEETAEALQRCLLRALGRHAGPDGRVDYTEIRASVDFAGVLEASRRLAGVDLARLDTRAARLAFWINVYNALAIHAAIALGLRRSVWEVLNFFGRLAYRIGGATFTLDEIEHGVLRGNRPRVIPPWRAFGRRDPRRSLAFDGPDPRIHFALTCGARSCPPVGVYHASGIDAQLDAATRGFVNDEVTVDERGRIVCSKIFKWYAADFEPEGVRAFLLRYVDQGPARNALVAGAVPCRRFTPYSWALHHRRL